MNANALKYGLAFALALVTQLLWVSPAGAWPEEGRAAIQPTLARVSPGAAQQFHAIQLPRRMQVARPANDVTWSVNGVPGGNDTLGRIDANGRYQAPATAPETSEVHILAEVPGATNPVLFATVILSDSAGYRSVGQWPEAELTRGGVTQPRRIVQEKDGHLILLDTLTGRLARYTNDGTYLDDFGRGPEGKPFGGACMVAVAPSGQVYTGDLATGPPRINTFNPAGDWLLGFGQKGSRPGMVVEPAGMAFHPDGRLYLADMDAMRVSIFDADHGFLGYLRNNAPEGNRTNAPSDVAIDAAGDLFVASVYGPCEKVRPDTGERLLAFAYPLPPEGLMYMDDIALDRWGNVYLAVRSGADPVNSGPDRGGVASILKYTNAGDFVTEIHLSADSPKQVAVTVDMDGRVYAAYATRLLNPEVPRDADDTTSTAGVEIFIQE